jgi:glycerophosphoryl diester phosphodiesterase
MSLERPYWPYPRIIAHRGGGVLAPENTLAALRFARNLGFAGVEFDVKLSADDVPILFHDDTLDRTTDASGPVAEILFDVMTRFDAGSWFANEFTGEPVPAFAAASALCKEAGLWANIEIKPCPGRELQTGRIVARMAKLLWSGAPLPPLLSSYSTVALGAAMAEAPELPRALLCQDLPADWESVLDKLDCCAAHVAFDRLTRESVDAIQATRRGVLAFTVNDSVTAADLLDMGVDALITDQLDLIGPEFAE